MRENTLGINVQAAGSYLETLVPLTRRGDAGGHPAGAR
jgi:hypothetical protein